MAYTSLAEDLANHGFIAVTVDPYDAPVVELWSTREVIEASEAERDLTRVAAATARAQDVQAVADRLAALDEEIGDEIKSADLRDALAERLAQAPGCKKGGRP